ncbi:MAG: DUF1413 domain-containing protein [Rhodobacteraceae bacterium]|nr:DUF1413 domain-containing protein [Paracoccaceae bacterium]QEW17887.1 hypothetical protein LA6_000041 [Marinibacterium anthonyi]
MDNALKTRLAGALRARPAGPFHFRDLYGPGWDALYIGDKVKLGNAFLRLVRDGDFPGLRDTGRKAGGGRVYEKTG